MRKILVISDTHGYLDNYEKVIKQNKEADYIIHLGDVCGDEKYIQWSVPYAVKILRGNNDWNRELADKVVFDMYGHRIFATHGHRYGVFGSDVTRLVYAALQEDCDIIMYGHTHVPVIDEGEEYTLINPGSLTYPRQSGKKPSYILMTMEDDGSVTYELKYVD
jgi:putative phosphoesterase